MSIEPAYPSIVELLAGWLEAELEVRAGSRVPADLAASLPFNQITVVDGGDDVPGIDMAVVDVDSYAGPSDTEPADVMAERQAERVRQAMRFHLPGVRFPAQRAWVSVVSTVSRPRPREYDQDDTDIARYQAAYRVVVRSRST